MTCQQINDVVICKLLKGKRKMILDEIIEKAKEKANIKSDYALAKALGIDRRIVSDWKKQKRHPNTQESIQLATLAGIEETTVIACIELEAAKTPQKIQFWKSYLENKGMFACITMTALAISISTTQEHRSIDILQLQNYDAGTTNNHAIKNNTLYIMRTAK